MSESGPMGGIPLPVGSGLVRAIGASAKAANLDRAVGAGIAVPTAVVIPHEVDWIGRTGDSWPTGRLAVRSAFSAEDAPRQRWLDDLSRSSMCPVTIL